MPATLTRPILRLRTLAVAQALVLLVALGAPIVALAAIDSVSPASLAQGATSQPVTITGSGFERRCSTYSVTFSGSGVSAAQVARRGTTEMTAEVTVAADAPRGLRDVTVSGSGRCDGFSFTRAGAFTVTAAAGIATRLAITSVSPASPTAGAAFSVVVQAQDAAGNPAPVTSTSKPSILATRPNRVIRGRPATVWISSCTAPPIAAPPPAGGTPQGGAEAFPHDILDQRL